MLGNIDHRRWSKRCTPLGVLTFKKIVQLNSSYSIKNIYFQILTVNPYILFISFYLFQVQQFTIQAMEPLRRECLSMEQHMDQVQHKGLGLYLGQTNFVPAIPPKSCVCTNGEGKLCLKTGLVNEQSPLVLFFKSIILPWSMF